jgi:hypothetical protein
MNEQLVYLDMISSYSTLNEPCDMLVGLTVDHMIFTRQIHIQSKHHEMDI